MIPEDLMNVFYMLFTNLVIKKIKDEKYEEEMKFMETNKVIYFSLTLFYRILHQFLKKSMKNLIFLK